MLNYCLMNNMNATSTYSEYKGIDKHTGELISRDEKFIIDYILVEHNNKRDITDTIIKRGLEVVSEHYIVITKARENNGKEIIYVKQRKEWQSRKVKRQENKCKS